MELHRISHLRFMHTLGWAVLLCSLIVGVVATLGRASANIKAALTDKPDIAVYLLLPEEEITQATLLRAHEDQHDYLVETKTGPKLVQLKKGELEWYVSFVEELHE